MSENVLFCPECHSEYEEGFTTCADCGVPLVRRLDPEAGDHLVPLAQRESFDLIAELLDRLEKQDVPYVIEAGTALELLDRELPEIAKAQPWEARVWVAESAEERALKILEELEAERQAERTNPRGRDPGLEGRTPFSRR